MAKGRCRARCAADLAQICRFRAARGRSAAPAAGGSFATIPLEESGALVKVVREFRPHVMITHDEHGGYPHPDHIRCHEVSMLAYERSGDRTRSPTQGDPWTVSKLYYTHGFIRARMVAFSDEFEKNGQESPFKDGSPAGTHAAAI